MAGCFFLLSLVSILFSHPLVISLGSDCGPAFILQAAGLREEAYPFDWTVAPSAAVCKVLQDDFTYFFTDLKLHEKGNSVLDYYGFTFAHDLPTGTGGNVNDEFIGANRIVINWEEYIPLVSKKYERRIKRFRNACLSNEKVFFLRSCGTTKEEAVAIRDAIQNRYPFLDFLLIIFDPFDFADPWNIQRITNHQANHHSTAYCSALLQKIISEK